MTAITTQMIRTRRFQDRALVRYLAARDAPTTARPPYREIVHLALEDLLILSLLCMWWSFIIVMALRWGV